MTAGCNFACYKSNLPSFMFHIFLFSPTTPPCSPPPCLSLSFVPSLSLSLSLDRPTSVSLLFSLCSSLYIPLSDPLTARPLLQKKISKYIFIWPHILFGHDPKL